MEHETSATTHHEFEDMLAPAALGALGPDEHAALIDHLRTCDSCRATLGRLMATAGTLPLTVEPLAPSAALRDRLRSQVTAPTAVNARAPAETPFPRPREAPGDVIPLPLPVQARPLPRLAGWLAAAAALLLLGVVAGVLVDRFVLDEDDDVASEEIALESPTGLDLSDASLAYLPDAGVVRFSAPALPPPPAGHVYQVWLIPGGQAPIPAGVIDLDTGEFASAVDPARHQVFAVTIEPAPLGSAAPTTDPVIVANLPVGAGGQATDPPATREPTAPAAIATPPGSPTAAPALPTVTATVATPPAPTEPVIEPPPLEPSNEPLTVATRPGRARE